MQRQKMDSVMEARTDSLFRKLYFTSGVEDIVIEGLKDVYNAECLYMAKQAHYHLERCGSKTEALNSALFEWIEGCSGIGFQELFESYPPLYFNRRAIILSFFDLMYDSDGELMSREDFEDFTNTMIDEKKITVFIRKACVPEEDAEDWYENVYLVENPPKEDSLVSIIKEKIKSFFASH